MRSTTAVCLISACAAIVGCGNEGGSRGDGEGEDGIGSVSLTGGTGDDDGTAGSADDDDGASGQNVTADGDDEGGNSPKFDLGGQPDVELGCGGGGGGGGAGPDFSYIWIANSNESTVSKINTESLVEEGRYITRPDSNGNPSRTSVNLNGDMAIANRSGGVTMIYARHDDCPDPTNTSTGAGDVKPWPDGCVGWHTPMAYASQRPVASST